MGLQFINEIRRRLMIVKDLGKGFIIWKGLNIIGVTPNIPEEYLNHTVRKVKDNELDYEIYDKIEKEKEN